MVNRLDECERWYCFWDSFSQVFINRIVYEFSTVGVIFPAIFQRPCLQRKNFPQHVVFGKIVFIFSIIFVHFFITFITTPLSLPVYLYIYCCLLFIVFYSLYFALFFIALVHFKYCPFSISLLCDNNRTGCNFKLYNNKTYINFDLTLIRQNWHGRHGRSKCGHGWARHQFLR